MQMTRVAKTREVAPRSERASVHFFCHPAPSSSAMLTSHYAVCQVIISQLQRPDSRSLPVLVLHGLAVALGSTNECQRRATPPRGVAEIKRPLGLESLTAGPPSLQALPSDSPSDTPLPRPSLIAEQRE